jgi:carbon-monoxide dehydrogenase medium subunit
MRITIDDSGLINDVRIALGAVAPTPLRSAGAEALLIGRDISEINTALINDVSHQAADDTKPISDVRASAAYRREVSKVLVKRGLEQVLEKLGGQAA